MDSTSIPATSRTPVTHERWTDKFERQAQLDPANTAVVSGNHTMNYGELSKRSNQIANLLRESGIGRGSFVGLGLHRCLELPAALLGILKSGAAYVPLDPGYPAARIRQMIESSRLTHVITQQHLAQQFPDVNVICMDTPALADAATSQPGIEMETDDFMYAIFTSGSTGQPKAATVYQRGFENLLHWYSIELQLGPSDRTLVISSPSFDLTQKNFFAPLVTGGTLILDNCQTYDISRISTLIRQHGVTLINCTPSAFYPIMDAAAADDYMALASIRFAVLGGEPISVPRLRSWLESAACKAEVVNSYGPTECTDICAFYRLHKGNLDDFPFVPLGSEIPKVQITIRDEAQRLVADGEVGELCISGAGVGGGYLYDSAKTAGAFVGSLYRTGDLAKRHPSNILEFRGRADHQIKLNGFRIELGEIETVLRQHDTVREAVVVAKGDRLTAHIQGTATIAELREHLTHRLPSYMIPAEFHLLDHFPLTPNGKIDRLALIDNMPENTLPGTPGTLHEEGVLSLWSEVLGTPVSDVDANFFDLGGNSIHVAIIHVRLMEMTGRLFPITELFARSTARSIADYLSPNDGIHATTTAHDRARLAQSGFSRFRRSNNR